VTLFTLHQGRDRLSAPMLIAHRFSWAAFLLGPFWLIARRMWLQALVLLGFDLSMIILARIGALETGAAALTILVGAFVAGLEGAEWRRRAAIRRGAEIASVATGANEIDALGSLAGRERMTEARS
jgi:hypothetical protein